MPKYYNGKNKYRLIIFIKACEKNLQTIQIIAQLHTSHGWQLKCTGQLNLKMEAKQTTILGNYNIQRSKNVNRKRTRQ